MSRDTLNRLARRALVLAATVAVIGAAVVTVQVAAAWRAEAAPLDTAPAAMSAINTDMEAEVARTGDLSAQIDDVAGQLSTLKGAGLQSQLKGAQARLTALNKAAARQAALNAAAKRSAAARTTATAPAPARGGESGD